MISFIRNLYSYFKKTSGVFQLITTGTTADAIVSFYSYAFTKNRQKLKSERCERRRVGILYADITNYSRLTERDEEGTHHRLVESMKLVESYVVANNGRVAHFAGDAILAEFKDADDALNCAINVQLSDLKRNAGLSPDRQILFRIGVNYGDVIADQDDIFGNAVNMTARLEKLAHTGGICVSESVRKRLRNRPSFQFIAMGRHKVKNISAPVEAFRVELDSARIKQLNHDGKVNA